MICFRWNFSKNLTFEDYQFPQSVTCSGSNGHCSIYC